MGSSNVKLIRAFIITHFVIKALFSKRFVNARTIYKYFNIQIVHNFFINILLKGLYFYIVFLKETSIGHPSELLYPAKKFVTGTNIVSSEKNSLSLMKPRF